MYVLPGQPGLDLAVIQRLSLVLRLHNLSDCLLYLLRGLPFIAFPVSDSHSCQKVPQRKYAAAALKIFALQRPADS